MPRLNIDTIIIKPDFSMNALAVLRPSNELGQARVIRAKPWNFRVALASIGAGLYSFETLYLRQTPSLYKLGGGIAQR